LHAFLLIPGHKRGTLAEQCVAAGERGSAGKYPDGSVNDRVQKKLQQFTEQQKNLAASGNQKSADTETD